MRQQPPKIEKYVIGSVRLDSDVWAAVRAMRPLSLNQYLRKALKLAPIPTQQPQRKVKEGK